MRHDPSPRAHLRSSARARTAALAGIALLVCLLPAANAKAQQPAVWRLIAETRIGQDQKFARIVAVLPASDGSVIVADAQTRAIRVFSRTGVYSHSVGMNRGYSEFEWVRSAGLLGDTLWVFDRDVTSFFTHDGTRITSVRMPSGASLTALVPGGATLGQPTHPLVAGVEQRFEQLPLLLLTRAGQMVDTLAWVPSWNANLMIARPDGGFTIGRQIFSDAGLIIVSPNAPSFFVVDRSVTTMPNNAVFRVVALRTNGDTLWNRTYAYAPRRLEKARGDSVLALYEPRIRAGGLTREQISRGVFIPEYYPPVTSAVAGSDGSLWLRREDSQPTVDYWIIGKDGGLLATLTVPANVTLMAATASEAWGMEKDQNNAYSVIRYRIDR